VVQDMGTGNLADLREYGIYDELNVAQILSTGFDLISFSGDKLLGGPQCGIIIGEEELVMQIRQNPLLRALRVGKLTYLALEASLRSYITESAQKELPVLQMVAMSKREISLRARRLIVEIVPRLKPDIEISLMDGSSKVGGGTVPLEELPTKLIAIKCPHLSPDALLTKLRENRPPIIGRIQQDLAVLDLRAVFKDEEEDLKEALIRILSSGR